MSKHFKSQLTNSIYISKLDTLLNSYNTLMSILFPNLSENNNSFMSSLIELIISQLKFFVELIGINDEKKIYKMLNSNNQNLSKQIAILYEIPNSQIGNKISLNSTTNNNRNENNKLYNNKESYSVEEKKESIIRKNSDKFEFNYNTTESKMVENDDIINFKNIDEKKVNLYINNDQGKENLNNNESKDKLIKVNNQDKEKSEIVKNLNFNNNFNNNYKEKENNIQVKTKNTIIKKQKPKNKTKEKENKTMFKKTILLPKNKSKTHFNTIKLKKHESPSYIMEPAFKKNLSKKINKDIKVKIKEKLSANKNKTKKLKEEKPESIPKINSNFFENNFIKREKEENDKIIEEKNENIENESPKIFVRNSRKSKTVLFRTVPLLPYSIGIETSQNEISPEDNYISITFSSNVLDGLKTPNRLSNSKHKHINFENINLKNKFNSENKKEKKFNLNKNKNFSLDEFVIPNIDKKGEKIFVIKKGDVSLNQKQKDILEDYINNYLYEDEDTKSSGTETGRINSLHKRIKNKNKNLKAKKNKKYVIKGTSINYNLQDVFDIVGILPKSFKLPITDFYLRKKKASMFDRGIFKICHKVIDNYKILEGKEDIFQFKKLRSKSKTSSLYHGKKRF